MHDIILPDNCKPALEWVNNQIRQKVSPERKHGIAQGRFWAALDAWAEANGAGTAATEWRFLVPPAGEIRRTLVPDIAYLSYERMPLAEQEHTALPAMAPDAVVEVLSPDDRPRDVEEKIRVYLSAGTNVVFVVDPDERTVRIVDPDGQRILGVDDDVSHRSLPGLLFPVRNLFTSPPQRTP
jgi:Uma2 family endonuclease